MFTGIVEAIGKVEAVSPAGQTAAVRVACDGLDLSDVAIGDSISVNGVCITVKVVGKDSIDFDVSAETLGVTAGFRRDERVNLEKSLRLDTRIGGHLVSGHVDGIGEVIARNPAARAIQFSVRAPDELARYIAHKGSICVDGTSLTVNAVNGAVFELTIVPHTLQETIMDEYQPGRMVNLEVDLIARYLERLLLGDRAADPLAKGVSMELLAEHGFIK